MIELIERYICSKEGVSPELLHTKIRERQNCNLRQMVMTLAIEHNVTEKQAGGYYGRDHATAHHSTKAINDLCFSDKKFREKMERYRKDFDNIDLVKKEKAAIAEELKSLEQSFMLLEFRCSTLRQKLSELKTEIKL